MEYAIELKQLKKELKLTGINIIYFGEPFCQNFIPSKDQMEEAYNITKDKEKNFVWNTPFVTDEFLPKVLNNIELLSKREENISVVFNDWGVFYEIKKRFPQINLILGRLLTKQRTDPNIKDIITNSREGLVINNIKVKKVPDTLFDVFKHSVVNDNQFQQYLLKFNVNRVEIEFLAWDMFLNLPQNIHATIYYPYAHIATTRLCGLLNATHNRCMKTCQNKKIKYKTIEGYPYIYIRNTIYYDIEDIMTKEQLKKYPNIDRIVFNDIDAYYRYINGHGNK